MSNTKYNHKEIEAKWQLQWESDKLFSPDVSKAQNPFFNLMMFPYPSAEGLHVGNMYAFTGADVFGRFQRMQGKDVLEPIGLDGFGIHSENYAMKIGRHPKEQAQIAEKNFYRQLKSIGNSFDWERTIETYDPNYYKWTQWIFSQMFKNGLAYRDTALVNWCPKDMTVLSDEQVIDGKCERCGTEVEKKELEQWFFRITKYAQRLLDNIEGLDWAKKVKIAQNNWIGRSEGVEIEFEIVFKNSPGTGVLKVFTTRPDTLFGATFMVLSPEHELVSRIKNGELRIESLDELKKYVDDVKNKSEVERTAEGKEKTGVILKGVEAVNPVNSKKIPILVSDYVLSGYGTGAIMAVPAHDQRDFETAKKFNFEIVPVIKGKGKSLEGSKMTEAYTGEGEIIGLGEWNGFHVPQDTSKVIDWLEKKNLGKRRVNFHLRDWLISRQRYWGPPIPMIFCQNCQKSGKAQVEGMPGWFTVPDDQLPVLLPDVADWKPMGTGKAPLANHPEFYKTTCPNCGGEATRETDVSDTFLDSSWYFLRYLATDWSDQPFPSINFAESQKSKVKSQKEIENWELKIENSAKRAAWLPVAQYIGGAEHAVLHLLYSRFVTMVLHDLKFIDFEEPFSHFFAHGLIVKDGAKMSKSRGNVVVPDEYIAKYGADTLRVYLMFLGQFSDGGDFKDSGIEGINRFINRIWKLFTENEAKNEEMSSNDLFQMHKTIKKVSEDVKRFSYNTSIASLMEWYNYLNEKVRAQNSSLKAEEIRVYLKLLAPFAPHITEELWQNLGFTGSEFEKAGPAAPQPHLQSSDTLRAEAGGPPVASPAGFSSIHFQPWPIFDEKYLTSDEVTIVVQINGKRRGEVKIQSSEVQAQSRVEDEAKEAVKKHLEGQEIKKVIYIPGKIINFVL